MLYIVGGAARSGKTLLAQSLLETIHVPWFSLDMLRAGVTKGAPVLSLDFNHDDLEEAKRLWPIVKEMFNSILHHDVDYLVEGSCLRPSDVAAFMRAQPGKPIRAVFLGSPDTTPQAKWDQIDSHRIGGNDWFSGLPDAEKEVQVERIIRDSRRIRIEAAAVGIPFIDVSHDFLEKHAEAFSLLLRPHASARRRENKAGQVAAAGRLAGGMKKVSATPAPWMNADEAVEAEL